MDLPAFNLGEEINNRKVEYVLHMALWDAFNYPAIDLNFSNWGKIKYLNTAGTDFNTDITKVPDNKGGLYLFFVPCNIITGMTEFPLYIGRAQLTTGQNLRKRVKEYFQKYSNNAERPKLYRMLHYWGKDLHLAYYPLDSNNEIIQIERDLTNSLLLPMNDLIPTQKIKQAHKAFK